MLAHIHPYLQWFTCKAIPIFNGLVHFGSVSRTSQTLLRAQSPFARSRRSIGAMSPASHQRASPPLHRSYGLTRQTKTLLLFSVSFIQQIFAGYCQSLLGSWSSLRYLCNPCIGAWTLTLGCLSGAFVRFFPENHSLTAVAPSSAHSTTVAMPLQR